MLKAITQTDILAETLTLAEMILQSESYHELQLAKQVLRDDKEAQKMILVFSKRKEEYEEVQRFGRYHPDYSRVSKEVRELKRQLDLYQPIANFKIKEKQFEELLNEISFIVANAVSEKIKVPTGNPFFDSMSCSGGCGSGGKCGCK